MISIYNNLLLFIDFTFGFAIVVLLYIIGHFLQEISNDY